MTETHNKDEEINKDNSCFYGIGVGPGDCMLITMQAEEAIRNADCLILPAKDKENCRAYVIAREAIADIEEKDCFFFPFPMSMNKDELSKFHESVAENVIKLLDEGKRVAFLTIGDVSIYSTFIYIEKIVKAAGYKTSYISGISSFSAAASRIGIPLTIGNEELHVIPGSGNIEDALKLKGTLVFMKSGKKLGELKEQLISLEKDNEIQVYAVSNCGMEDERIYLGAEEIEAEGGYLTVVIVRKL